MDYIKVYGQLIDNAKIRSLCEDTYYEKHHIIMKSHGGSDDNANLVYLTAREHFIAHWLLWKIHRDPQTAYAWWTMVRKNKLNSQHNRRYNVSSRLYEAARLAMVKALKSRKLSEETKAKISKNSARKGKPNWNTGIKWKKKNYRTNMPDDQKKKLSDALKGRYKPKVSCPHCGKIGGRPAMKRFHFDNCKEL